MIQEQVKHYAKMYLLMRIAHVMECVEHAELVDVQEEFRKIHHELEVELKEIDKM